MKDSNRKRFKLFAYGVGYFYRSRWPSSSRTAQEAPRAAVHSPAVSPGGDSMSRYPARVAAGAAGARWQSWNRRGYQSPKSLSQLRLSQLPALQPGCSNTPAAHRTAEKFPALDSRSSFSLEWIPPSVCVVRVLKGAEHWKTFFSLKKGSYVFWKNLWF